MAADNLIKPGEVRNPLGRPKGSRNKLGEEFVAALHADFMENGKDVIQKVRADKPDVYLKVIAQVVPKEVLVNNVSLQDMPDDELVELLAAVRSLTASGNGKAADGRAKQAPADSGPRGKPN